MQTPAGKECRYFYGDYHRGRNFEECRLFSASYPPQEWTRNLCFKCLVPNILQANACPNMLLRPRVTRPLFLLKRRVEVDAYCEKTNSAVSEPHIGCGECHVWPNFISSGSPEDT